VFEKSPFRHWRRGDGQTVGLALMVCDPQVIPEEEGLIANDGSADVATEVVVNAPRLGRGQELFCG
jgi:hypothetical protein